MFLQKYLFEKCINTAKLPPTMCLFACFEVAIYKLHFVCERNKFEINRKGKSLLRLPFKNVCNYELNRYMKFFVQK